MNFKKLRKLRRETKAISPIIATLLLIAIAVVAALVTYAWVMGYIGFQTSNSGNAVQIQSVSFTGTPGTSGAVSKIYLQNVGPTTVTLNQAQCLYINGVQDSTATIAGANAQGSLTLASGSTAVITSSGTTTGSPFASGTMLSIKVTTTGSTYSQITQQVP